ncbi:hypothetical protein WICMUC_004362 [Wickerhamomyces mucosus]|uniref:BOD1/SHG1 domain-containing protein n=1 Tax=Wickerhamomyces mucosus TaxID=1378264 RepID=A0A9P8PJ74_9ASCO|nr:hypothetical protein WICMUC_004362 [Wickerhamomyces mucosus]
MNISDNKSINVLYKRKGHFDAKREELVKNFKQTEAYGNLVTTAKQIVESIIRNNPKLLVKNRGQLTALIEGTISRYVQSMVNYQKPDPLKMKLENDEINVSGIGIESVYSLIEEEIKDSTICSYSLKEELMETLKELRKTVSD